MTVPQNGRCHKHHPLIPCLHHPGLQPQRTATYIRMCKYSQYCSRYVLCAVHLTFLNRRTSIQLERAVAQCLPSLALQGVHVCCCLCFREIW